MRFIISAGGAAPVDPPLVPTLTAVVPDYAVPGTTVVITGTNLGTGGVLYVGDVAVTPLAWIDVSISFVVPSLPTGDLTITVVPTGQITLFIDFRVGAVAPPPPPPPPDPVETTEFSVMDYGAHADGVSDDSLHIRDAFLAAHAHSASGDHSTVVFPAGTYLVATGWSMPTIRTNDWLGAASPSHQRRGVVCLSGYGATIKYRNATTRFTWLQGPNPTLAETTYGNLEIEGFTIDDNWRHPTAECASILWMQGQANYDNITITDVTTTTNFPNPRDDKDDWQIIAGIMLTGNAASQTATHWGYCTDINIIDCEINSQKKPITILASVNPYGSLETGPWGQTHYLYDNILVDGGYGHNHHYCSSNVHLVQAGSGNRITVRNWSGYDSADDGIEINNSNEVLIEDCHFEQNRQAVCYTCFGLPYAATVPNITIRRCTYSGLCGPYWPPTSRDSSNSYPTDVPRSPYLPEVRGYTSTTSAAIPKNRSWGNFLMEDCTLTFGVANAYLFRQTPLTFGSNNIPMESVTIRNCDITDVGSTSSTDQIYVKQGTQLGRILPVTIQDVRWRNTAGGSYALLTAGQVALNNPTQMTVTTDIPGL